MNILLSAVGRRAYLVKYFQEVVHPLGGRVYATNTTPDATGFLAADEARIVPPSASSEYVDVMVGLCKEWNIRLLFSDEQWKNVISDIRKSEFWKRNWNYPVCFTEVLNNYGLKLDNIRGDFEDGKHYSEDSRTDR